MKEGDLYILTAYFTDPKTICSGVRKTAAGYTGDNLYLAMNNGPVKIPLKETAIGSTQWTKGRCFYGMGNYLVNFSFSTLHICMTQWTQYILVYKRHPMDILRPLGII